MTMMQGRAAAAAAAPRAADSPRTSAAPPCDLAGTTESRSLSPLRFSVRLRTRAWGSNHTSRPGPRAGTSGYLAEEHVGAEHARLEAEARREENWSRWGPYLSERQWGTVREDYSPHGSAWEAFPHDHARSRAYRWGEDGLLGICDRQCRVALALALWNERDPILKERLFGLTGPEGNHGEDVKELYYYLDATPTASYLKALYKYPQSAYPYSWLVDENRRRTKADPEFELLDTGVFDDGRYFDVTAEYAKAAPEDVLLRVTVTNRGADRGADPRPADGVVPQHLELGRRLRGRLGKTRDHGRRRLGVHRRPSLARSLSGRRRRRPVGPADAPVHRQRDQR